MPRSRAHAACQDFHRATEAARRDVFTRRQMLRWGIGAGVTVYAANVLPTAHLLAPRRPRPRPRPTRPSSSRSSCPAGWT